jgi:DNA-binding transcriptional ArsR family regulator
MENNTSRPSLAPAQRRNLPNRILRAFDNAKHIAGLPRSAKDTLAEICRFVKQSAPFETIFPHRVTIAERIGASERTVYRHLQLLQVEGLIEVLSQDRKSHNGKFSVARIRLTVKAAELLGFVAPREDVIHTAPSATLSDGHTLTEPTSSDKQLSKRTENGLPMDLSWLTGNGLKREGIFKLMKIAKNHNKLLSDIVLVVHQYIKNLKGGHLYAYLNKLASGTSDFSVGAANERRRIADEAAAKRSRLKEAMFRERFRGTALASRDHQTLYLIDGQARFAQIFSLKHQGGARTMPLNDVSPLISALEEGRIVLATSGVEQKFMALYR